MRTDQTKLYIDEDIKKASTLPTYFYTSPQLFESTKESIFASSWQLATEKVNLEKGAVSILLSF